MSIKGFGSTAALRYTVLDNRMVTFVTGWYLAHLKERADNKRTALSVICHPIISSNLALAVTWIELITP